MIEALGITLREAIEAILVIFIMAAYLERTGRSGRKRSVYAGALAAVGLSLVLAVVLTLMGMESESELVEGFMYFAAGALVGSLVVWMWRKARFLKQEVEKRVEKAASGFALAMVAFIMVLREGIETVVFLQSLLLSGTSPVESLTGGILGIALALILGLVFLKGTAQINLSRFFKVTAGILVVLVLKLIAGGFHELFEVGVIPSNEALLSIVGFLARSSTGSAIIGLMLIAMMAMVIYDVAKTHAPDTTGLSPAARRKAKYKLAREKYTKIALSSVLLAAVLAVLAPSVFASHPVDPEPVKLEAPGDAIEIEPGQDGFYKYRVGEATFLMVVREGRPYTALDRCYICPPKGYGFDGSHLVCFNCEAPVEVETVGMPGGCNPVAVDFSRSGDRVSIDKEALRKTWEENS